MRETVKKENLFFNVFLRKKEEKKIHVKTFWTFHIPFCSKTNILKKQSKKSVTPQNWSILVISQISLYSNRRV